ncbi:MAG: family 78 glycoside hydrolase catalytic domain [Lentisphaeria bacterium]|nr:family 78 glycoside hydrolase catalytic domain [Lentisphaeria bacterium]
MRLSDPNSDILAVQLCLDSLLASPVVTMSTAPLFSWKMQPDSKALSQSAYQIEAGASPELLENGELLWDSGRQENSQSLYIPWGGTALQSRQEVFWRVRLWDELGRPGPYSEIASFRVGLLENADWQASWVYYEGNNSSHSAPCPYFRRDFSVRAGLRKAILYISARGLFAASLNGDKIGNDEFVPGWTDYAQQLQYMCYDLSGSLPEGDNALGVILGDGWYSGYLMGRQGEHISKYRNHYGQYPELLLQLELEYEDGGRESLLSDQSWKCRSGPILYSDIYDGEMYDARLEMPGWNRPGFDDSDWRQASLGERASHTKAALVAKSCPPVRQIEELKPLKYLNPKQDVHIWDFGQNISGKLRIKVKGHRGRLYTCKFAEMLYPDGTLYNQNYRSALSTDYYYCAGPAEKTVVWEPLFTFHGFRYVQLDGIAFSGFSPEDVELCAVALHSDLEETSSFHCGHAALERLFQNIRWGQKGNFLEIPTDCPQRDERLGWTGDAHVFCVAASINMNIAAFMRKWLRDLREAQREDGAGPSVAPDVLKLTYAAAVWADAIIACPWIVYQRFGNIQILQENYVAMQKWLQYQIDSSEQLIRPKTAYGDWLAPEPIETPSELIGTAMLAYGCQTLGKCARILQKPEDANRYEQLFQQVRKAFQGRFLDEAQLLRPRTQTACVMALHFGLLDARQVRANRELLADLIVCNGKRLSTGFVGTAWLLQTLSEQGLHELAWDLMLQEELPSWLYSVKQGATTVWERWDSYSHEKGFGKVTMNSFNHYAYGAVLEWLSAKAGGIDYQQSQPGGRRLLFAVQPDPRLGWAQFSLQTPYGKAESSWKLEQNRFQWQVTVPPNCQALLKLPKLPLQKLFMNGEERPLQEESFNLNAGNWHFLLQLSPSSVNPASSVLSAAAQGD